MQLGNYARIDLPRIRAALNAKNPPAKKKLSNRELVHPARSCGVMIETQGKDPYLCPKCQVAEMVVVEVFHGIRGSPMRYARPLCHRHKPAQFTSFIAKDKKVKLVV